LGIGYAAKGMMKGYVAITILNMKANWREFQEREEAREDVIDTLTLGTREINKNMNGMEGWADRIMRAVLAPAGTHGQEVTADAGELLAFFQQELLALADEVEGKPRPTHTHSNEQCEACAVESDAAIIRSKANEITN
jgi:hypothetical protein